MTCLVTSCHLLPGADGSAIVFNTSSSYVKPLVSTNLTLTCKIQDTPPVGPAIGKRSVPSNYDLISEEEGERRREDDDVTRSDDLADPSDLEAQNMTKKSVSHTDDNVPFVTNILISRDGVDLVSISDHFGVRQLTSDVIVTGQLSGGQGVGGELQITWPHPTLAEAGNYRCDVTALSAQAHSVIFSQTINIAEAEVTMSDLVSEFHRLKLEKENMEKTIDQLNKTLVNSIDQLNRTDQSQTHSIKSLKLTDQSHTNSIDKLELTDQSHTAAIHQLNLTDQALLQSDMTMTSKISSVNQSLTSLRDVARVEPNVLFSAIVSSGVNQMSRNQVLIFDKIVTSEGHGYDNHTGVFTAPVDGFYLFHVHLVAGASYSFSFALQHNGNPVIYLNKYGNVAEHITASDSVIVKMKQNDQVKVASTTSSSGVYGENNGSISTMFTGRLVSL